MTSKLLTATALALALATPSLTMAQNSAVTPSGAIQAMKQDQMFAMMVGSSDQYEIRSSEMALQRSQNEAVRQYAQKMVTDHKGTTTQLGNIALGTPAVGADEKLTAQHQMMLDRLSTAQGNDFTGLYLDQQIMNHQQAVQLFSTQIAQGENGELKAFATQNLPHIQNHLAMATQMRNTLVSQGVISPSMQGSTGSSMDPGSMGSGGTSTTPVR